MARTFFGFSSCLSFANGISLRVVMLRRLIDPPRSRADPSTGGGDLEDDAIARSRSQLGKITNNPGVDTGSSTPGPQCV